MPNDFVSDALASAHKFMDNEKKSSVGTKSDFTPKPAAKPQAETSDYSHARSARKASGSFMGVNSDQGSELKGALANHEAAKAALAQ